MKPDPDPDLDQWMDELAGRHPGQGDAQRLGAALREAAARRQAEPVSPPELEQLLAAAGPLAGRPGCAACARLARVWAALQASLGGGHRPRLVAGLLSLFLLCGVLLVWRAPSPDTSDTAVLRGVAGPMVLRDADPLLRRERIAGLLEAQGVVVRRHERLGRVGLDAQLDFAQRVQLAPPLKQEGIIVPPDGVIEVEIEKAPP